MDREDTLSRLRYIYIRGCISCSGADDFLLWDAAERRCKLNANVRVHTCCCCCPGREIIFNTAAGNRFFSRTCITHGFFMRARARSAAKNRCNLSVMRFFRISERVAPRVNQKRSAKRVFRYARLNDIEVIFYAPLLSRPVISPGRYYTFEWLQ